MRHNRTLFLEGFSPDCPLIVHCTSRIVDRQFLLGDQERETFIQIMREYEEFSGIRVLSHCIMSNHFHILLEIPPRSETHEITDQELFKRLAVLHSEQYLKTLKTTFVKLKKNKATKTLRELREKHTYRIGNLPEFMKAIKQRFSRWYNATHGRKGTLWEQRYSATAVSAGSTARIVAAYIDLNPLRAGIVDDPAKYRWCSYAEAVAGENKAKKAYQDLHRAQDHPSSSPENLTPEEALQKHTLLLAEEGQQVDQAPNTISPGQRASKLRKRRHGYTTKQVEKIIAKNGKLTQAQLLRCKTRYFTDSIVIGTKTFVNNFIQTTSSQQPTQRKTPARPIPKLKTTTIHTYRNLQKNPFGT